MDFNKLTFCGLWVWIETNTIKNKDLAKEVKLHLSLEISRKGYTVKLYQIYESKGENQIHLFNFYETDTFDKVEALEQVAIRVSNEG